MRRIMLTATVIAACVQATMAQQPATETTAAVPENGSHYEQLKALEWLVGEWVDEGEESTIATKCGWTKNRNFLLRTFKVVTADDRELEGTQVIGWDPDAKRIRSWMFDSEGGFGEGHWTQKENRWIIKVSQTLKDGVRASAINVLTYVDDNTITWQSTGREIDGELQPDVPEITVVRK